MITICIFNTWKIFRTTVPVHPKGNNLDTHKERERGGEETEMGGGNLDSSPTPLREDDTRTTLPIAPGEVM